MKKFILVLSAVAFLSATALTACAPVPCPGGGTTCGNVVGDGAHAPVKH